MATRTGYHKVQERLLSLGFAPDTSEHAPICRTRTSDGLVLDTMPIDEQILGFSNRWYPLVLETAQPIQLADDLHIMGTIAPAFLATKWEAYRGRGAMDPMMSHDLEDLIAIIAGRPDLPQEMRALPSDARAFVRAATAEFLADAMTEELIAGNLPDARLVPGIVEEVLSRMKRMALEE